MKKLAIVIGTIALIGSPAFAADLSRPVYKAPSPATPPPQPTFTGCYVNGGAGYGLWNIDHFGIDEDPQSGTTATSTVTSGGRGWLGTVGGGCDYQFGPGSGFWSNWVVGAFADYDFMDLHRNFQSADFSGFAGDAKESSAWAVGARIGYMVTPNVFTYWNGGYTQTHFDQINLTEISCVCAFASATIGSHTYSGWFIGGGTEISLSGLFGLPLPSGLFWRSEYRFSSFNGATLPITNLNGIVQRLGTQSSENMKPYVQTITTSLVWKFNWGY